MIVVDTSAIVAIFAREADAQRLMHCIAADGQPVMSAPSVLECSIVIRGFRQLSAAMSETWLDEFLASAKTQIDPVGPDDLRLAREAHVRYGKGTGHPAQLNFGDCFSYALAKRLAVPLLYKGSDFTQTDVASAL